MSCEEQDKKVSFLTCSQKRLFFLKNFLSYLYFESDIETMNTSFDNIHESFSKEKVNTLHDFAWIELDILSGCVFINHVIF